jgi:hypothetical protein
MHVMPAAVRRGCAVNDDAVYVPCFHAAMMAAGGGLGKAEGVPGDAGLRLRIGYYLLGGLSIDQLFMEILIPVGCADVRRRINHSNRCASLRSAHPTA